MIKCGTYTGNSSSTGPVVNLGWQPQWLLIKNATNAENWYIFDTMRGIATGGGGYTGNSVSGVEYLLANSSAVADEPSNFVDLNATGFQLKQGGTDVNANGNTYIYMAIRGEMMVEPSAATDVFAVDTWGSTGDGKEPALRSGFPVDFVMYKGTSHTNGASRLTGGGYFRLNTTNQEAYDQPALDYNNGYYPDTATNTTTGFMWKRAKGFFDVVCYPQDPNNSAYVVPHSLGVVPEMMWIKTRDSGNGWQVYTSAVVNGSSYLHLNENYNYSTRLDRFNNTAPTATNFTVGDSSTVNGGDQIAFLFASLDGISKCGSYTGNGTNQTIDCGFSAGARFVLIKRANVAVSGNEGDWYFWDSVRGIVAGNDPHFSINTTAVHVTTDDSVDPANAGFIVNQVSATNINVSSSTYIFYAIA